MELKLALQRIEPYESFVSETWCPPNLVPTDERMDKEFFESFLMDEFSEEVWDYFNTEFDDILSNMIGDISFVPKARYSLEESYGVFRDLALEEARKTAEKYRVIYTFTDEDKKKELFRSNLDLKSMMEEWVNNREDDCQSSPDVGGAMIRGMEKYVSNASWHCKWISDDKGKKPVMWFGLDDEKPEEGWILNTEKDPSTGLNWNDFWFCYDSSIDWENRVPDADNVFLTWMTAECDMSLPPLKEVLKTCPIEVNEQDDYSTLTQKIAEFLQKQSL